MGSHSSPSPEFPSGFEAPSTQLEKCAVCYDTRLLYAEPGSYWLIKVDGRKIWPGIVCDPLMVTKHLQNKPRPKITIVYPMLYLGTTKIEWVARSHLWDLHVERILEERNATESQLLKSIYEDVFNGRSLDYWKYDVSARLLEHDETDLGVTGEKRKHTTADVGKPKRRLKNSSLHDDLCGKYEDDSETDLFQRSIKKEDTKREGGMASNIFQDQTHHVPHTFVMSATNSAGLAGTTRKDIVNIYVGNPFRIFPVKLSSIPQSAILLESLKRQGSRFYIMNPILSEIDTHLFTSVVEFLNHSDYNPKLLEEGTVDERLENINSKMRRSKSMIQCGLLYQLAGKLQLSGMQALCFRKLKAIKPIPVPEILGVIRILYLDGRPADERVNDHIVSYFSSHFYAIWEEEWKGFLTILKDFSELAREVHERMGRGKNRTVDVAENRKGDVIAKDVTVKQET